MKMVGISEENKEPGGVPGYSGKKSELFSALDRYTQEEVAVAFSGGADSSFLLKAVCEAARRHGSKVYAVTVQTELHTPSDLQIAEKVAKEMDTCHIILKLDELAEAGIENNPVDRCYRCKKLLFTRIREEMARLGVNRILEGTNADDLTKYRPGLAAIKELGVMSPLADAGITKAEVRTLAAGYGISVAERPASPCMATRFPYGVKLTKENMKRAELGEAYMRAFGFYNVRLRVQDNQARIEVDLEYIPLLLEKRHEIVDYLKNLGYQYVALDLEGFRSGSMDEVLFNQQSAVKGAGLGRGTRTDGAESNYKQ